MKKVKDYNEFINETSEFNLQRFNSDSVRPAMHVDDPKLSVNHFDKHEDIVRQAISRLNLLSNSIKGGASYKFLKSKLSLEEQDIKKLNIVKIVKDLNFDYDVYIKFEIKEKEYWGVIKDIIKNPEIKSEVFLDGELIQTKEWEIKTKGVIINSVKDFLKPQFGHFKSIKDDIHCFSELTGKLLKLRSGEEIEVLKSYDDRIIFEFKGEKYRLVGDYFIYFNWWFEFIR